MPNVKTSEIARLMSILDISGINIWEDMETIVMNNVDIPNDVKISLVVLLKEYSKVNSKSPARFLQTVEGMINTILYSQWEDLGFPSLVTSLTAEDRITLLYDPLASYIAGKANELSVELGAITAEQLSYEEEQVEEPADPPPAE